MVWWGYESGWFQTPLMNSITNGRIFVSGKKAKGIYIATVSSSLLSSAQYG